MGAWTPEYRILANGDNVTGITVVGFTINAGRQDINSHMPPSYASISLINLDNTNFEFTINTGLTIEVKDSTNTYVPIFGGRISDISNEVESAGSTALITRMRITAVGSLVKLQRALYSGNLAEGLDGDQIADLLAVLFSGAWNQVSAATTWNTYDPTTTWANAETTGTGQIDAGEVTLRSRQLSDVYIGNICNEVAKSAGGYMYEDQNGDICYADRSHRQDYWTANGYVDLDAGKAFWTGISSILRQGDIVNSVTIDYGNNFNNSYTATDNTSRTTYGLYAEQISSYIKNQSDAEDFADRVISLRAFPRERFQSITFALQNPEMTTAERDALIGIFVGMPISLTGLPALINLGRFEGFVEGWSWRSSVSGLSLTITASPTSFNLISQKWSDVNIAEAWNTINTALTWNEVTIVA